jgi:hypothetical protein
MSRSPIEASDPTSRTPVRERWSIRTTFIFALVSVGIVSGLILLLARRSIWVELELVLGTLSVLIFMFFFTLLYRGVRFDPNETFTFGWVHPRRFIDHASSADTFGTFTQAGANQGIGGFILGLLLDIVVSLVLVFAIVVLVWLGVNLVIAAIALIWVPLFYLFRRSVRYVVARGRTCRGHIGRAARWALAYTLINVITLYAILVVTRYLVESQKSG